MLKHIRDAQPHVCRALNLKIKKICVVPIVLPRKLKFKLKNLIRMVLQFFFTQHSFLRTLLINAIALIVIQTEGIGE